MKHLLLWQIPTVKAVTQCFFAEMQRIFPARSVDCQMGWLIPAEGFPSDETIFRGEDFLEGTHSAWAGSVVPLGIWSIVCMSMPGRGKMCFPCGNRRWEIEDHWGNNQPRSRSEFISTSVAEWTPSFGIPSSYLGAKAFNTHLYCIPPVLPLHVQKSYHF